MRKLSDFRWLFRSRQICLYLIVAGLIPLAFGSRDGALAFQFSSLSNKGGRYYIDILDTMSNEVVSVSTDGSGPVKEVRLPEGRHRLLSIRDSDGFYCPPSEYSYEIEAGQTLYIGKIEFERRGRRPFRKSVRFKVTDHSVEARKRLYSPAYADAYREDIREISVFSTMQNRAIPLRVSNATTHSELKDKGVLAVSLSVKGRGLGILGDVIDSSMARLEITSLDLVISGNGETPFRIGMPEKLLGHAGRVKLEDYCETYHLVCALPPGDYRLENITSTYTGGSMSYFTMPTGLEFSIVGGRISYLGDIFGQPVKDTFLWTDRSATTRYFLSTRWERDESYFKEVAPFLETWDLDYAHLEPINEWNSTILLLPFEDWQTVE